MRNSMLKDVNSLSLASVSIRTTQWMDFLNYTQIVAVYPGGISFHMKHDTLSCYDTNSPVGSIGIYPLIQEI